MKFTFPFLPNIELYSIKDGGYTTTIANAEVYESYRVYLLTAVSYQLRLFTQLEKKSRPKIQRVKIINN
jgi:hypothetical protein